MFLNSEFEINNQMGNRRINGIPNATEEIMSITIGDLRFIDSLQFLYACLETLVDNSYGQDNQYNKNHSYATGI